MSGPDKRFPYQQRGYNAWVKLWVANNGEAPSLSDSPALFMQPGDDRNDFIAGWNMAKRDNEKSK